MTRRLTTLTTAILLSFACPPASPQNCRLYPAGQYTWDGKRGFYLCVQGCELAELPIALGVADGKGWRFITHVAPFGPGQRYTMRAGIAPEMAEL